MKKDFDGAERAYLKALELDENHANALGNYANLLSDQRNEHDRAEVFYQRALSVAPENSIHRVNYARFLDTVRNDALGAEGIYRVGLAINPDDALVLSKLADFKLGRRTIDEAVLLYESYLRLRPDDGDALANYGTALLLSGAPRDRVASLYRDSLARQPDGPNALVNLAQILLEGSEQGSAQDVEADALIDRALASNASSDVEIGAWFYRYANIDQGRAAALQKIHRLILAGARSEGWDFSGNLMRAARDGHPNPELLETLSQVIAGTLEANVLDKFDEWTAL